MIKEVAWFILFVVIATANFNIGVLGGSDLLSVLNLLISPFTYFFALMEIGRIKWLI